MITVTPHKITEQVAVITVIVTVWLIIVDVVNVEHVIVDCVIEELVIIKDDKFLITSFNQQAFTLQLMLQFGFI